MTTDIKINLDGDIDLSELAFELVTEIEYIEQKLSIVLRFFLGEWFLDTSYGVPYFEDIFKKDYDPARIESVLKTQILAVLGVNQIVEFDLNLVNPRQLDVDFTVTTDFGELTISESLT